MASFFDKLKATVENSDAFKKAKSTIETAIDEKKQEVWGKKIYLSKIQNHMYQYDIESLLISEKTAEIEHFVNNLSDDDVVIVLEMLLDSGMEIVQLPKILRPTLSRVDIQIQAILSTANPKVSHLLLDSIINNSVNLDADAFPRIKIYLSACLGDNIFLPLLGDITSIAQQNTKINSVYGSEKFVAWCLEFLSSLDRSETFVQLIASYIESTPIVSRISTNRFNAERIFTFCAADVVEKVKQELDSRRLKREDDERRTELNQKRKAEQDEKLRVENEIDAAKMKRKNEKLKLVSDKEMLLQELLREKSIKLSEVLVGEHEETELFYMKEERKLRVEIEKLKLTDN